MKRKHLLIGLITFALLAACARSATPTLLPPGEDNATLAVLQTQLAELQAAQNQATSAPPAVNATPTPISVAVTAAPTATPVASLAEAPLRTLDGQVSEVFNIAFSPRGSILAAATSKGVQIWDINSGQLLLTLAAPPTQWATDVDFSADGTRLTAVSNEPVVWVWDTTSWQIVDELQGGGYHTAVALSANGNLLAAAGLDTTIFIWRGNEFLPSLGGHTGEVTDLVFTSDGSRLLSASTDGTVRLFNPNDRAFYRSFGYRLGQIWGLALRFDNGAFAAADSNGEVMQWDLNTTRPLSRFTTNPNGLVDIAYQPLDGKTLLTGARDGAVQVWNADNGQLTRTVRAPGSAITGIAYSADARLIAAADTNGLITLWLATNP